MRFYFRPALTVATLLTLGVLASLGTWQLHRLEWKRGLIAQVEVRIDAAPISYSDIRKLRENGPETDFSYTPVEIKGRYRHDLESHVFGTLNGAPGYYVFTPLRVDKMPTKDGVYIYVNRGFVPQNLKDIDTRTEGLPGGDVTVRGLLRRTEPFDMGLADFFRPESDEDGNIWHERRTMLFAANANIIAAPDAYIDSFGEENAGDWPKGGTTRIEFSNRHFEYALTWFGLAAALLGVYGFYSIERQGGEE